MKYISTVIKNNKKKFLLFCLVGSLAFILDGLTCQLLIKFVGLAPSNARAISIFLAMNFSWLINRSLTFNIIYKKKISEWIAFITIISFGNAINYFMFLYSIKILGESHFYIWLSLMTGSLSGLFFNFTFTKFLYKFFLKTYKSKLNSLSI